MDPAHLLDRGARLNVLGRTEHGTLVNIEVQVANQYNIDKRTMFYWACLYHGQLTSGQKFSDLRKTVAVNVLAFDWFQGDRRHHRTFHVRDDETGELLNDDLEIHFLELEKIKNVKRRPKDALEAWMMYLNNLEGEELEAIAMGNPGIRKALTIEKAFWQSKKERRMYELREKAVRDEVSALAGARDEGRAEGKIEMAQEAICKYLEARFGESSRDLRKKVKRIGKLETLDEIINEIYTASSLKDARSVSYSYRTGYRKLLFYR